MQEVSVSLGENQQIKLLEPVSYHQSLELTESARLVVTDSGGLAATASVRLDPPA